MTGDFKSTVYGYGITTTPEMAAFANGGMGRAYNPHGHFPDTVSGEGLTVNLSATANVGIDLEYLLV